MAQQAGIQVQQPPESLSTDDPISTMAQILKCQQSYQDKQLSYEHRSSLLEYGDLLCDSNIEKNHIQVYNKVSSLIGTHLDSNDLQSILQTCSSLRQNNHASIPMDV